MATIDTKAMLDDARGYDAALLSMLLSTDRQAMSLFRIYVTLAIAILSILATNLLGERIQLATFVALGTAAIFLILGCYFCIRTMATAPVGLPGRRAEFWTWAMLDNVTDQMVLSEYLKQAREIQDINHSVNQKGSTSLRRAKQLGIAAFALGAASGVIVGITPFCWAYLRLP